MKDWFIKNITLEQAYKLYEDRKFTTQYKNGEVIVEREEI